MIATMLGTLALGLMITGVILNNVTVLVAVASVVFATWFVTTVHHLVEAGPRPSMQAWKKASL